MKVRTSIWPYDILRNPIPPNRESPNHLRCFLICPFKPKEFTEDLTNIVKTACSAAGKQLACHIECIRADQIVSSGVIHAEIWNEINTADVIVADVTGLNGNVMVELGVTSACRKKEHVIVLKEENPEEDFLFDIDPIRHIIYKRGLFSGYQDILQKLINAIMISLTSAPYELGPNIPLEDTPKILRINFNEGKDADWLIGPSITHRKMTPQYLEYGSLFIFRNSWLRVKDYNYKNFRINTKMQFAKFRENTGGWIGISIRNHHFFANYGHLLYVNNIGRVIRTVPKDDLGNYEDNEIGRFKDFHIEDVFEFKIEVNDRYFTMYINDIGNSFNISEMPYVYGSGKILFQTYNARVGIHSINIERL